MLGYTIKRVLLFVPMLVGVLLTCFLLMQLVPGDPVLVLLGEDAGEEVRAALRRELGLDQPLPVQFLSYVAGLFQGDLGQSLFQNESVLNLILARLPATLELATAAMLVSIVIGVTLGVLAAVYRGTWIDTACSIFAQFGVSMTVFWLGILLMFVFSVQLNWLPAIGRGPGLFPAIGALFAGDPSQLPRALSHLVLPAFAMGIQGAAIISRLVRASMLEVLTSHFVRTARAKGVKERKVVWRHAFANALLPVVTVIGWQFGTMLSGSVLLEGIFGWPGLGQLTVTAISQRDIQLVQGLTLVFALIYGVVNLLVDLLCAYLDPRISVG